MADDLLIKGIEKKAASKKEIRRNKLLYCGLSAQMMFIKVNLLGKTVKIDIHISSCKRYLD